MIHVMLQYLAQNYLIDRPHFKYLEENESEMFEIMDTLNCLKMHEVKFKRLEKL